MLSLVYHYYILIGMDEYLPADFHRKKRVKVISLPITAQLGVRRTSQIMEIFDTYSLKLNWLHLIAECLKIKSDTLKKPKPGMYVRRVHHRVVLALE